MARSLGVDLHAESNVVAIIDPDKGTADFRSLPFEEDALRAFERELRPDDRIALEATTNAYYFYERWQPLVAEVVIANPVKLRPLLAYADKSDRNDAFYLALLNQLGALPLVYVPDQQTRQHRELLEHRANLVGQQTKCLNRIRSLLRKHGLINPKADLRTVDARDLVVRQHTRLPKSSRMVLNSMLAESDSIQARLDSLDACIKVEAARHPDAELLLSVPGLGLLLSLTMMACIGDISRFPTPGSLVKYAGLAPKEKSSGGKFRRMCLPKTGCRALRWAASEAVQSLIRQPGRFRALRARLLRKGRANGVAMAACARKLLTIIWHILSKREPYREESAEAKERKQLRICREVKKAQAVLTERPVVLENLLKHAPLLKELAGGKTGFPISMRLSLPPRAPVRS